MYINIAKIVLRDSHWFCQRVIQRVAQVLRKEVFHNEGQVNVILDHNQSHVNRDKVTEASDANPEPVELPTIWGPRVHLDQGM